MELLFKGFAGLLAGLPPLVGLLLLGSVLVNIVLWKEFRACERGRLADNQAAIKALAEVAETSRSVAGSIDHRNRITQELIKSVDDLGMVLKLNGQTADHHFQRLMEKGKL
jgi:hypothetical protein